MADNTSRIREQEGISSTGSTGGPTNQPDTIDNDGDNQVDIIDDDDEDESHQLLSTINQQSSNEEEVPKSVIKIVKELDDEFEKLSKNEMIDPYSETQSHIVETIHRQIDKIQKDIKENGERTNQHLKEIESRIIDEMTCFFLNADNFNVIEKKRPKNITFRNQYIN